MIRILPTDPLQACTDHSWPAPRESIAGRRVTGAWLIAHDKIMALQVAAHRRTAPFQLQPGN